jgi:hypothetical protein
MSEMLPQRMKKPQSGAMGSSVAVAPGQGVAGLPAGWGTRQLLH